jgi:hypothetical protein
MATKIFVNLPIKDLNRSVEFFTKLGYTFNAKFTNESATCMVISDTIFVMLLMEKHFQNFTKKEIVNAKQTTEVIIALDAASREEVDTMVKNAVAAGGSIYREPDDYGWMYSHSFEDLDGHQWEILYMNESQMPQK